MTHALPFDPLDPEALAFEDEPDAFVRLDCVPIVFTVRGIRFFSPRFAAVAIEIAKVRERAQFDRAKAAWDAVEFEHLQARIASARRPGIKSDPYNALQAVLDGDPDKFEVHLRALEHKQRAGLSLVTNPLPDTKPS